MLCTALGLALARTPSKALLPACLLLVASALAAEWLIAAEFQPWALIGCAASILVTALIVHLPRGLGMAPALLAAVNAGFWCGAIGTDGASPLLALPLVLVALPARWIVARDRAIVLKVLSGWLVAVAVLAAALPLLTTPGYEKDHRE